MSKFILAAILLVFVVPSYSQKLMSDREADGLKSNVKSVSTESSRLKYESGKWLEDKRQMDSVETFDSDGNLISRQSYDYRGNPFQLSTYFVIDGDRAVKQETKRYDYDPPLMVPGYKVDAKPRDPRYSFKLSLIHI